MVTATPSISQMTPTSFLFLVHKVEINVAPINAQGGIGGSDSAALLVIPEGAFDKLLQTFIVPGVLTSGIFLYPAFKILFPSKEDLENKDRQPTGGPGGRPGGFGGLGGPRGPGARGPGGLDPEAFAKSKAKIDLDPCNQYEFR